MRPEVAKMLAEIRVSEDHPNCMIDRRERYNESTELGVLAGPSGTFLTESDIDDIILKATEAI